jgi:DNA-directed RNA polymerase specialized sigma24 family protein
VLLAALAALPRRQREVIALRVFLDLDMATTARLLGIAPGTVGAHLSRAVTTLRAALPTALAADALAPGAERLVTDQLAAGQEATR